MNFKSVLLVAGLLGGCLAPSSLLASPNVNAITTTPPGTQVGNPNMYPDNPHINAQAYANIGHIAILKAANMQSTSDQAFTMFTYAMTSKYLVTSVYATNCTVSPAGDAGGIYTTTAKGGTQIVAAAQTYAALASVTALQQLTVNVPAQSIPLGTLYLSLTTGTTGGPCDFYIDGIGLQ